MFHNRRSLSDEGQILNERLGIITCALTHHSSPYQSNVQTHNVCGGFWNIAASAPWLLPSVKGIVMIRSSSNVILIPFGVVSDASVTTFEMASHNISRY